MKLSLKSTSKGVREFLIIAGFNILLSAIGLFLYPGHYLEPALLPWVVWALAYIGYIPIGGFLLWGFIYWKVLIEMLWIGTYNLPITIWTWVLLVIWLPITAKRSIEMVARIAGVDLPKLEEKT